MTGLLVQRVEPLSVAYDGGIERGEIILEINRQAGQLDRRLPPRRRRHAARRRARALPLRSRARSAHHSHRPHGDPVKPRILVIDDEAAIRDSLQMILEYEGYEVMQAATGDEGVKLIEREAPDLVFLDIKMPGMDGLEVLQKLRHLVETTPIVVISGHADITTAVEATRLGRVRLHREAARARARDGHGPQRRRHAAAARPRTRAIAATPRSATRSSATRPRWRRCGAPFRRRRRPTPRR